MRDFARGSICLLLAAASLCLLACGSVVVIEGEATGASTSGAGGTGGEGNGVTASSSSGEVVDPPPSDECPTICAGGGDESHCACKRFCDDPSFAKPNAKITCAPINDGAVIQCVCTYGEDFSGVCFEKNNLACDFEMGCCAKYFYGK
ncbi:MAG: hypothetical protein ABI193_08260 [Minicystis sp.]